MPHCKTCGKVIGFILSINGKYVPVEPGVKQFVTRDGEFIFGQEPHGAYCQQVSDKQRNRSESSEKNVTKTKRKRETVRDRYV